MEINNVNASSIQKNITSKTEVAKSKGLKKDTFEVKATDFEPQKAEEFLLGLKDEHGKAKFDYDGYRKSIISEVQKSPDKWPYVSTLAQRKNVSSFYLADFAEKSKEQLTDITKLLLIDDKNGEPKFMAGNVANLFLSDKTDKKIFNNALILSKTDLSGSEITKVAQDKNLKPKKIVNKINEISNLAKDNLKKINFEKNKYSKGDYTLTAIYNDDSKLTELLDKNFNRYAIEKTENYISSSNEKYQIKKSHDYRNNIISKIRYVFDKDGSPLVSNEIRILKDKNDKVLRTEYTSPSEVKGVMDVKYVYPNGKVEQISSGTIDKKTGIVSIKKNMVSAGGTRTEYLFEDDPKGNRISDYKITDKNGKVLLKNSESFEVISENKFISAKNNEKYEITSDDLTVTVKDLNNPNRTASFSKGREIIGKQDEIIKVLKKMPGEELLKLHDNVRSLNGTDEVLDSSFHYVNKQMYTGDDLFVILHELGHAVDSGRPTETKKWIGFGISSDEQFNKIYEKEKKAFNKLYPDAQRNHMDYFLNQETHKEGVQGGRQEIVAESNALLTTAKSHEILAMRSQYLQQHFPETIAYLHEKLNAK